MVGLGLKTGVTTVRGVQMPDNTIELNGDIHERFQADYGLLGFSNGALLSVSFEDSPDMKIRVYAGWDKVRVSGHYAEVDDAEWVVFGHTYGVSL